MRTILRALSEPVMGHASCSTPPTDRHERFFP
ncbi:MAG: hypothetical protein JWO05_1714 [Gemmatimonadetes bacterium]|nr:hypothetical protein [Gemmatimonadota bacterium]